MPEHEHQWESAPEYSQLIQIRRDRLSQLKSEGRNPFKITSYDRTAQAGVIIGCFEEYESKRVSIAGRIVGWRNMGKATFLDIADMTGKIQVYIKINNVGEEQYEGLGKWDIGDIAGIEGEVFKTRAGEISVKADNMTLLAKSLKPLPEKWHGLKDTDARYRQRYVDLIINADVRDTFIKRSKIIQEIRSFLNDADFLEVETPVLNTLAGGALARPFVTHHNALDIPLYLRIAIELHLKRLIVGGFDKVYEIGRVFRNEGISTRHNPEFTILELYEAYTDYYGMMRLTENMFRHLAKNVIGSQMIVHGGVEIDIGKPFARLTMVEAVKKYAGVDFKDVRGDDEAKLIADKHGVKYERRHAKGDIINLFFEKFCEDELVQPTFIMDHPVEISPLAKRKPDDPGFTERFELFIMGREYANAFSELNDPIDQRARFEHQMAMREAGDEEAAVLDEDFLNAMEYGMPPIGGIGIGIDRLVMLLTDNSSIRDVLLFPTMKPL